MKRSDSIGVSGLAALLIAGVLTLLMAFSYLGAFLSPQSNTHRLPIAVVDADRSALVMGTPTRLGEMIVAPLLAPQSADTYAWERLSSRAEALSALCENRYDAALVIPPDYSARVAAILGGRGTQAAQIELLTNPAAGPFANAQAQAAGMAVIAETSQRLSRQIVAQLNRAGRTIPASAAGLIADPVRADLTIAAPIDTHSARGLAPFYIALMLTLGGLLGAAVISVALEMAARGEGAAGRPLSRRIHLAWRLGLCTVLAAVVGAVVAAISAWQGVSTGSWGELLAYGMLAAAAVAFITMMLLTAFGLPGQLLAVIFFTVLGVPSAGAAYPYQMLPAFWQWLYQWLPLRFTTDGLRSLLFYQGNQNAGLHTGILVLAAYAIGGAALIILITAVRGALSGRRSRAAHTATAQPQAVVA